jgi:hypothetical protein
MNKRSERVDGKTRSRNAPAATQDPETAAGDARSSERAAGPRRQKTPAGTTARKRRPPFVL